MRARGTQGAGRSPVPEAKALEWPELLPSTRSALLELFEWLDLAVDLSSPSPQPEQPEQPSTSLLIAGNRGFGKTTLLLTAAYAHGRGEHYCESSGENRASPSPDSQRQRLAAILPKLRRRVCWLETLDLEPLSERANLLAILLVSIRKAFDERYPASESRGRRGVPSILEPAAEKPWGQIDRLVRNATFMWEDAPGGADPRRERAEQQLKAAEIFVSFQQDFRETLRGVSEALGADEQQPSVLVLPIDNVDRSIEHLYGIVKLVRMASSPRLWFLLASGRPEFQLFLERSFQKELAASGALIGTSAQDQTRAIARRQAATTMRRSLPSCFQIRIDPVPPHEAWSFPHLSPSEKPEAARSLGGLLERVGLPCDERERLATLRDLFDLGPRLRAEVRAAAHPGEPEPRFADGQGPELGYAAKMALALSARTLRDLLRDLSSLDKGAQDGVAEIVVRMLKSAIDESNLPSWASEQLHNRIIRRDAQERWILDLSGKPVRRLKRTTLFQAVAWPHWQSPGHWGPAVVHSELHLRKLQDMLLELHDLAGPHGCVQLPANVAGWFMLAHDLLTLYSDKRVLSLGMTAWEMAPELIVTLHELSGEGGLVPLELCWSLPTWETFLDFNVFTRQWRGLLGRLERYAGSFVKWPEEKTRCERYYRLLLAAWVDNVCSVARPERGLWSWESSGLVAVLPESGEPLSEPSLERYEQRVRESVARLVQAIAAGSPAFERLWMARVWLEQSLPLLVLPEHAPHPELTGLLAWKEPLESPESRELKLKDAWEQLERSWRNHERRLIERRRALVSEAIRRGWEQEASRAGERRDGLEKEWFEAADKDATERKTELLGRLLGRFGPPGGP
ncbi:MAG TPA: hypothetical protein DFS52_27660 [Myxococcales bacterium]|nr:hypothetical protein [Myxococcales bacterium]